MLWRIISQATLYAVVGVLLTAITTFVCGQIGVTLSWKDTSEAVEDGEWVLAPPPDWIAYQKDWGTSIFRTQDHAGWNGKFSGASMKGPLQRPSDRTHDPKTWVFSQTRYDVGWPLNAARAHMTLVGTDKGIVRASTSMLDRGWIYWPDMNSVRIVACYPVMPGAFLNSAFYGFLAFAAVMAFRIARSRIRRLRGICSHCAYQIEDFDRCPECGTKRKAKH